MNNATTFAGPDVHARSIKACAFVPATGEKYPFSVLPTLREGILLIRPKRSQKKACAIVRHGLFQLAR